MPVVCLIAGGYLQDKVDCVNEDASHCPGWAASGECQANPAYMLMSCALSCGLCPPPESREDFWKALSSPQRHMELQSAVIGHLKRRHHGDCIVDSHGMRVFEVCPGTRCACSTRITSSKHFDAALRMI